MESKDIKIGDKVVMKKGHPCGFNEWIVVRYGADVKLECVNCKRIVMLDRVKFLRNVKKVIVLNEEKVK